MNLKNDTGTAVTPVTGLLQKSSYEEHLALLAELVVEEVYPERAELFLAQYLGTDDVDLRQQLSSDLFREFGIVVEPTDRLPYPNNITTPSDCI
ncbi:MAG TPA: hypothetical protein EYQ05_10995 [Gammaproteobacteria bacterium]|nr:hypothetical protein [Gammaproteobacteria bacterium]